VTADLTVAELFKQLRTDTCNPANHKLFHRKPRTGECARGRSSLDRIAWYEGNVNKIKRVTATTAIAIAGLGLAGLGAASIAEAQPGPSVGYHWCPGEWWDPGWGDNWDYGRCHDDFYFDGEPRDRDHWHGRGQWPGGWEGPGPGGHGQEGPGGAGHGGGNHSDGGGHGGGGHGH